MAKQRRYREKTAELITVLEGLLPDHRRPPQGFASACGSYLNFWDLVILILFVLGNISRFGVSL
jgi:hypothetical protein